MHQFFRKNIGKRFKEEITDWLSHYPEIKHQWNDGQLEISHPKKLNKKIIIKYHSKGVTVNFQNITKIFSDNQLTRVSIDEILTFVMHEVLTKKDSEITKPILETEEVTLLITNQYGQVLTHNFNTFNGWGNVYRKFKNINLAKRFITELKAEERKNLEINIFDKDYHFIEREILD